MDVGTAVSILGPQQTASFALLNTEALVDCQPLKSPDQSESQNQSGYKASNPEIRTPTACVPFTYLIIRFTAFQRLYDGASQFCDGLPTEKASLGHVPITRSIRLLVASL